MDDDAEVEAIYRRYGPMVVRRCRRLLGEETEAWDVAQEVFVRVLKQWPRLDHRYPSSLLFRIATNLSLNRLRDRRREPLLPGDEVLLALREGQRQELTRSELKQAERLPTRLRGSERVADTRLPRFGIRYTARAVEGIGASSFESRLEFAYRPSQRFTIRPRYSPGWNEVNLDYVIGTSVDYHFRPDRNWRPYLSVGVEWQNRFLPDPIRVYEPNGAFQVHEPWPEAGRNRTFFTAAFGMERRLSRHWSFVAELATTSPEREAVFSFNGLNWQSASSGGYLELGVGLSFNFGGRGDPKAKSQAP